MIDPALAAFFGFVGVFALGFSFGFTLIWLIAHLVLGGRK